jgi:signal transduction histidine kinase
MRLSDFILANREPILVDWEAFARKCGPASQAMDITSLRDHANEMLTVIAADLKEPQSRREQTEKSKGNAPDAVKSSGNEAKENSNGNAPNVGDTKTAAEKHGADRAEAGFSIDQMVSEYRALRASVIRLWTKAQGALALTDLEDLTRFNEAIDQALSESVTRYTQDLDYSKEMFLAILGHDLRTPLGAISTAAKFMIETQDLKEPNLTLMSRIASSSVRMSHMVGDLLDFTRSRLGGGIPITRAPMRMERTVKDVVDEIGAAYPSRTIEVDADVTQRGDWDCPRISQALTNLIGNALEHGSDRAVVRVVVRGDEPEVTVAIHNQGDPIPKDQLSGIFNPMKRKETSGSASTGAAGHLGLGLYIADRIVNAHKGTIDVDSSDDHGTTFTVHLPRGG